MKKSKITRKQIIIQLLLLAIIALSVGLLVSLISYDPSDPGWSRTAWHYPVTNFGGYIGAYAADILLQFLGFIAYSIPFITIFICFQLMIYFYRHVHDPINYFSLSFRIIGVLAFIFSTTGFFTLNIQDTEQFTAGGYLGSIVIESLLPVMNSFVTSLVLLGTCLACVTLLTGLSWLNLTEKLGAFVMLLLAPIRWLLTPRQRNQSKEANLREDKVILTNEQVQHKFTIPLDKQNLDSNVPDPLPVSKSDRTLEPSITAKPEQAISITAQEDEKILIKTAAELIQTLENTNPQQTHELNETDDNKLKKEVDPNDILARMELIIKNMNERKIAIKTNDSTIPEGQINNLDVEPVIEEDKFTIADAPSKPLFTEVRNEPIVTTNNNEDQQPIIDVYTDDVSEETEEYLFTEQEKSPTINLAIDEQPHQILENLSAEASIDDLQDDTVTLDDDKDSLIHPLLRRNDKPLPKPTTPLPSLSLLTAPPKTRIEVDHAALNAMSELIEKSLADYRVKAKVVDYLPGPVITRFEIELAPGIKAARISTLDRDLARSLSMPSVRVVEVIPGKPYVGIELPNKNRQTVYFREVLDSPQFRDAQSPLTVVLGKDIAGQSVVADLAKMPHLLVAGTTGSGKSVGVNAMILSILYKSQPEDVRFIMIDPKMLELSIYEGIPHLLTPVVTDMKDAANALNWCVNEMEKRYRLMSALGVRNIAGYNEKIKQAEDMNRPIPDPLWKPTDSMDLNIPTLEKLPYIVVMVDEFADLIMAVGKKVEELIARLAQKARAAGIHLVLATQRPSVDVITGLIKANIPTRIAFTVSSKIDSRTILDQMGAESLLGMGDMLYLAPNSSIPIRVHGAFVRDEEVHAVVQDWKARGAPKYIENVTVATDDNDSSSIDSIDEELDPLFDQVVAFVVETRRASISSVQRKFRIGYNRAARIVEQMEIEGIISAPSHNGNREVLAQTSHNDY